MATALPAALHLHLHLHLHLRSRPYALSQSKHTVGALLQCVRRPPPYDKNTMRSIELVGWVSVRCWLALRPMCDWLTTLRAAVP